MAPVSPPAPFARLAAAIPVTVVNAATSPLPPGTALVRLMPPLHAHAPGAECPACASRGNVRVLLFELQEKQRLGLAEPFESVVVEAGAADLEAVRDALVPGRQPAFGLRDHAVLKNFHLASES